MKKIAIFASGTGTNAEKIIQYFQDNSDINVVLILSNKTQAGVLEKADTYQVPSMTFNRETFYESETIVRILQSLEVDLLVLAGFLWLLPESLIKAFPQRIINIHPALLPKFGGKGMYGMHVHQAVWDAKEEESGITIHWVNEHYDEGEVIFQAKCQVLEKDTPETIQKKVQHLEHEHFPRVIEEELLKV